MVIGLTGLIGAGKSTVAAYLVERYGFQLVKFAAPLKDMLRAVGMTEEELEGRLKNEPSERFCGRTPRYVMQTLGTEWGRNCIGTDLWVNLAVANVRKRLPADVVLDDCRFMNEARAVREQLGGVVWRIDRGLAVGEHESESGQHLLPVDSCIENRGTLAELYLKIDARLSNYYQTLT